MPKLIHKLWNTESNNLVRTEAKFEGNISRELVNRERKTKTSRSFLKEVNTYFLKTELSQIVCFISHLVLTKIGFHLFWSFENDWNVKLLESGKLTWRGQIETAKVKLSQCSLYLDQITMFNSHAWNIHVSKMAKQLCYLSSGSFFLRLLLQQHRVLGANTVKWHNQKMLWCLWNKESDPWHLM